MLLLRSRLICAGRFLDVNHELVFCLLLVDRPGRVVDLITINIEGGRMSSRRPVLNWVIRRLNRSRPTYMYA